jgi:hypothetical protein
MPKPAFFVLLLFCCSFSYSQNDWIVFKKKYRTITRFYKGSYFAFQLKTGEWKTGYISKVQNDSFWIRPQVIYYGMIMTDTLLFSEQAFSLTDVRALPKNGVAFRYINGEFRINGAAGHQHWYWIKSGWVFMVGAAGYTILDATNGLIRNDFTFSGSNYKVSGAIFLCGLILHKTYKLYLPLGKKYHLETIKIS